MKENNKKWGKYVKQFAVCWKVIATWAREREWGREREREKVTIKCSHLASLSSDTQMTIQLCCCCFLNWAITHKYTYLLRLCCCTARHSSNCAGHSAFIESKRHYALMHLQCTQTEICIDRYILSVNILSILLFLACFAFAVCTKWYENITTAIAHQMVPYFNPVDECRYHFLDSTVWLFVCLFACYVFICLLCLSWCLFVSTEVASSSFLGNRLARALIYSVDKFFFLVRFIAVACFVFLRLHFSSSLISIC